jgi:uncharacterized integral membrane protein
MQFLKTVFWVLVAVVLALFAKANWKPVTLKLWNDIVADVQLPLLLLIVFLLGFLPIWLVMRARIWSMRRRLDVFERPAAPALSQPATDEVTPAI